MSKRSALLATADGEVFRGRSVGVDGVATGEAVFNTSMTGYQEILTDPSYAGQVVVMTTSHIGNYGVTPADEQSSIPAVAGFVMRSMSRRQSNWRARGSLSGYLRESGVVAVADIDTRRLTRHLRDRGAMPVAMGTEVETNDVIEAAAAAPHMDGQDLASTVSTKEAYRLEAEDGNKGLIVALDLGMKTDIVSNLTRRGFDVEVVPANTAAPHILDMSPAGVFLSNGPGDPEPCDYAIEAIRRFVEVGLPVFGICLGHQLLALASGAKTEKMKFGHHGANHPVETIADRTVMITSQNHGFAVDEQTLPENLEMTHRSLFDGSLQGIRRTDKPAFSFQGHPEASPGPRDCAPLFDRFIELMENAGR